MDVREGVQGRRNSEAIIPETGVEARWEEAGDRQEVEARMVASGPPQGSGHPGQYFLIFFHYCTLLEISFSV